VTDNWNLDDDNINENSGPKPLRDAYAAQKKQNEELAAQLSEMQKTVKTLALNSTFDSLGVPGEVRGLYQGEPDPAKAAEWVNQMRTAFGGAPQGTPVAPVTPTPAAPSVDPQTAANLQNFSNAGAGQPASTNLDEAFQGVNGASSVKDLIANFQRFNN